MPTEKVDIDDVRAELARLRDPTYYWHHSDCIVPSLNRRDAIACITAWLEALEAGKGQPEPFEGVKFKGE